MTQTPDELAQRMLHRRAVEAVIWGMPAVNTDLMFQAMAHAAGGDWNQIVFWSRLPSWKNQTLTPNPDAIYLMPFINTAEAGPMVLEIPPATGGSITGSVDDCWECALEDVGPAGVDAGKGGKYLILPPGYAEAIPDGYIVLPSDNFTGFALLRSILRSGSDADVAAAVDYAMGIKLYPLCAADHPPATVFVDAIDVVFDATIPYDLRFFESLDRAIQTEPWLARDRIMIEKLKSIGIEKGKPFNPDAGTRALLEDAVTEAQAWLAVQYEASYRPPFNEESRWALPVSQATIEGMSSHFADPNAYPTDERGLIYTFAFFCAKHLGAGQFYLLTIKDKAGDLLDGASHYRLTVPANAPIRQYWSATLYDSATHAFIRDLPHASRSSQNPGLKVNDDGSVDLFFGPTAPAGRESNWAPTKAGRGFEVMFRFYGPLPPLFDKSWKLPDIERLT